jgi:NAD(P)-dependent dehydrogenase (short-subunit alcohol dehydrogenase family)
MSTQFDFDGRVALVTGATRGIGFAIARALLAAGARGVTITGRGEDRLAEAEYALAAPERVLSVAGSADDPEHADEAVRVTLARFGGCDVLVNNAGTNPGFGPLMTAELSGIEKTWAVNLTGPLLFARAAWHGAMSERGGTIVNIASIGGIVPMTGIGAYNIAKAGLIAMTRQLAQELAPNVRVNAIAPGVVKTRLSRALYAKNEASVAAGHPLGRIGEPEDVASAALFLASDAASWMTGETLVIDGGTLVRWQPLGAED